MTEQYHRNNTDARQSSSNRWFMAPKVFANQKPAPVKMFNLCRRRQKHKKFGVTFTCQMVHRQTISIGVHFGA